MDLGVIHLVRWALYADLGLLFGAPLFAISLAKPRTEPLRRGTLALLALVGLSLSLAGFALTAAGMAGASVFEIDPGLFTLVLTATSAGWAFMVRLAALVLILASTAIPTTGQISRTRFVAVLGAVAVGSLAWSGHAAASEGVAGTVRLAGDIAHMLAASVWLGALVILLRQLLVKLPQDEDDALRTLQMLSNFGGVGSVLVATLILTGILNAAFLFTLADLPLLPTSPYGQLLLIKLVLFAAMLGLAALNRFQFTPALVRDAETKGATTAVRVLRLSVGLEFTLASLILALVGLLGTLEPPGHALA